MDKGKDFVASFKKREDSAFEKFVALEKCKVRDMGDGMREEWSRTPAVTPAPRNKHGAGVLRSPPHVVSARDPIRSVFFSCSEAHRRVGPLPVSTTLPKDFLSWPWLRLTVRARTYHPPTRPPPHWNRSHGHANEQDLREQMKECYRVEGVNHLENCKHIVSAYLESLQVRAW